MVTRMSFGVLPLPFPRYALAPLHFRQVSATYTRRDNISKYLVRSMAKILVSIVSATVHKNYN